MKPWNTHAWDVLAELGVPPKRIPGSILWWKSWRREFRDDEIEAGLRATVRKLGPFTAGPAALYNHADIDNQISFRIVVGEARKHPRKAGTHLRDIFKQLGAT